MRRWLAVLLIACWPGLAAATPGTPSLSAQVLALMERELPGWERQAPEALLLRSLEEAERTFPDSLALRGPVGRQVWLRARHGGRVDELALQLPNRLSQLPNLLQEAQDFIQPAVRDSSAESRNEAELALVRGLLSQADPQAQLLTEESAGDPQVDVGERFGGIGMHLGTRDGFLTVISVLAASPAERAGIQRGDRVLEIEGHSALGLPVSQAARLVKGPVGSRVSLAVLRAGEYAPRTFGLVRRELAAPLVRGEVLREARGQRIGYLRIENFLPPTATEVRGRISRMLPDQADFLGLVLDLRDNSGGLLDQAIQVADLLLDNGRIVSLKGPRIGSETVEARSYRQVTQAPVIVLINERTASAAEIVAAALKSNRRALIVGNPSYGKTTIQSVFPLSNGNALKLTVAQFAMGSTDAAGHVVPHLLISPVHFRPESEATIGLTAGQAAFGAMRAGRNEGELPLFSLDYMEDERLHSGASGMDGARSDGGSRPTGEDFALTFARLVLFANHRRDFGALNQAGLDIAAAERHRQDGRVEARLRQSGIAWQAGPVPANPAASIETVTLERRRASDVPWQRIEGPVKAGDELRISVAVRNQGNQPLHRVLAILRTEALGLGSLEFPLGVLQPAELRTVSRIARLSTAQPAGTEGVDLRLLVANGPTLEERRLLLSIDPDPPPGLRVAVRLERIKREGGEAGAPPTDAHLHVNVYPTGPVQEVGLAVHRGRTGMLLQPKAWELFPARVGEIPLRFDLLLRSPVSNDAAVPDLGLRLMVMPDKALTLFCEVALPTTSEPAGRMLESPAIHVTDLPRRTAPSHTALTIEARDDRAVTALLVWLNGRKAFDRFIPPAGGQAQLKVAVLLTLESGRNLVVIEARDEDGFSSRRTFVLWHEQDAMLAAQVARPYRVVRTGDGETAAGGFNPPRAP